MDEIETLKIVSPVSDGNPQGYTIINAADLKDGMVIYKEPAPSKVEMTKADAGKNNSK